MILLRRLLPAVVRAARMSTACLLLVPLLHAAPARSLFDGRTLDGWEGDPRWWKVEAGAILGGSRTEKIPRNFFLATTASFQNFELRLQLRLSGVPKTGLINSGVQIRSVRVPASSEMSGYQVDAGDGWWGKLYDESRRNKVIAEPVSPAAAASVKTGDWTDYRIRAEGPRIRSWINGVPALDYTEASPGIARDGHIGIQIHSGGIAWVEVRDVTIEELPPTPDAPTWDSVGRPQPKPPAPPKAAPSPTPTPKGPTPAPAPVGPAYNDVRQPPRTPAEQRASFVVPPEFEVDLIAAESPGLGKFIAVAWDARMRLWTMTALEYPVDGNENAAESDALFARGGRDRVVVFDQPYGPPGTAQPRIFADGLVMPLGIQPWRDGVIVQYGPDLRHYRDTDGDGRADRHDVILTGFGTQDSHLFPHQFSRQPGGWLFVAQGLFNRSVVRRPDGQPFADGPATVAFNQCKLARMALDGSRFENLTAGPNNIWGLATGREGDVFLQEANDMGYPVFPYSPGVRVPTGSRERLRPYQPLLPAPLAPAQMGGTGLSGLALAEDRGSPFASGADGGRLFYLANPITGTIQRVRATDTPEGPRHEKLADFLRTDDRWFRPVAIQFGPDGGLYIVDWYNPVISHNEVPRNHPDRDKARGRIWRVRPRGAAPAAPPDLTRLDDRAVLARLGDGNALVSRLAWLELIDRRAAGLRPDLERLALDPREPSDRRLAALWAAEGLDRLTTPLLRSLAADAVPALRREAVRIAGEQVRSAREFVEIAGRLAEDPVPAVRAALGDALRRVPAPGPEGLELALRLGQPSLATGPEWIRYHREFDRYLARWALEVNATATRALLASDAGRTLPAEARILAWLALGGPDGAREIARILPPLERTPHEEEVRLLTTHASTEGARTALTRFLASPSARASTLRALLDVRTTLDTGPWTDALTGAAAALLTSRQPPEAQLGAEVAGAFKLAGAVPALEQRLAEPGSDAVAAALLRALRELGAGPADALVTLIRNGSTPALRDEALATLALSRTTGAADRLVTLLPGLAPTARPAALERLASHRAGGDAVLAALRRGQLTDDDLSLGTLDQLRQLHPGDPLLEERWRRRGADAVPALRLAGGAGDFVATQLSLKGPFTVEAWVKLAPGIDRRDGLLAAPDQLDLNFHAGRWRAWIGGEGDVVVATRPMTAGVWTHCALTRDADGAFRLYLNGELNAAGTKTSRRDFTALDLGRTQRPEGGTEGWLAEVRVWSEARTAEEIRDGFDRSYAGTPTATRPATLRYVLGDEATGQRRGTARMEPVEEGPLLQTPAEAARRDATFARFRALAGQPGDATSGRRSFASVCLTCHVQGGQGGQIGPPLDGIGLIGTEALLRNIVTPSAAMESAYRTYRVVTTDGTLLEGFLAEEDKDSVLLRLAGAADRRIPRAQITRAGYLRRSLMPEGLLEALPPQQVSDLFAYLRTVR